MTGTDHMQFDGDLMTFNMFIASVCIYMCVCVCVYIYIYIYTYITAIVSFEFCIRSNNETCQLFIAVNYHKL